MPSSRVKPRATSRRHYGGRSDHLATKHNHLAPLYVNEGLFPPVDDALVLAVVKQTALDDGCGPALLQAVGNGSKNGPRCLMSIPPGRL